MKLKDNITPVNEVNLYARVSMDSFHYYADKYIPEHLYKACYMDHMRYENLVKALFNDPVIKKQLKHEFPNFNVQYASNIFVKDFFDFGFAGEHIGSQVFYIMGKCHGKTGFNLMFIVYHDGKEFKVFTDEYAVEDVYHPNRYGDYRYGHLRSRLIKEFGEKVEAAICENRMNFFYGNRES